LAVGKKQLAIFPEHSNSCAYDQQFDNVTIEQLSNPRSRSVLSLSLLLISWQGAMGSWQNLPDYSDSCAYK